MRLDISKLDITKIVHWKEIKIKHISTTFRRITAFHHILSCPAFHHIPNL